MRRTHGGAVLPTISAHEDSFARRLEVGAGGQAPARARPPSTDVTPRETIFLDSSTTSYYVARRMVETGLTATVLTNTLPVMELVFNEGGPELDLIGIGGTLRRLTRSFVGPFAVRTVQAHFADRLFLSVKGLTADRHDDRRRSARGGAQAHMIDQATCPCSSSTTRSSRSAG